MNLLGKKLIILGVLTLILAMGPVGCFAGGNWPLAWWGFDDGKENTVLDSISGTRDRIDGNFKYVRGVDGRAIKFDGFTGRIVRKASEGPELDDSFTIEAWVALGAYPWNWCPMVSQAEYGERGYYFGIDSQGRFGLGVQVGEEWVECKSEIREELKGKVGEKVDLELRRWYHVAGVYEAEEGIRIYKDGKEVGRVSAAGEVEFAPELDILIGRNRKPMAPTHPVRTWATYPSWYSFDGIMDEVKIYGRALSDEEISEAYRLVRPRHQPEFATRAFPTALDRGRFGAFYTRLKYYDEWDALWRVGDEPDLVVEFGELPIRVMFWRGSRYSPCWVTENGKWMADQSRETGENWDAPRPREEVPTGCCEHMSDAQCRFSHVRLIESSDARVVVHWRYALVDVLYRQSGVDPTTGWGNWGDEYYTIYPDGVGTRRLVPGTGGWQETIFFSAPGTRPEDNCELEAITLVNLKGESRSYSWEYGYPEFDLEKALIQMTNLKAKYRPFMIFRPGSEMEVFNVEVRPQYSHFPWWNHWPVAQVISDGRHAQAADRMAHSSLAWGGPRDNVALYGMTDKPAVSLVSLAKSWIYPAELKVRGRSFVSEGYNYRERAYVINCQNGGSDFESRLAASAESPVVNPAFVIKNWGKAGAVLKIGGRKIKGGRSFRYGHRDTLEGTDLIVWIKKESVKPVEVTISRSGK